MVLPPTTAGLPPVAVPPAGAVVGIATGIDTGGDGTDGIGTDGIGTGIDIDGAADGVPAVEAAPTMAPPSHLVVPGAPGAAAAVAAGAAALKRGLAGNHDKEDRRS